MHDKTDQVHTPFDVLRMAGAALHRGDDAMRCRLNAIVDEMLRRRYAAISDVELAFAIADVGVVAQPKGPRR